MNGILDVGGGMRGIYGAGVFDRCLDENIGFDVCLGVSAGGANVASFLAGQKGRNLRFYAQHSLDKRYMSFSSFLRTGSFFGLDYIYTTLTNEIDPIDFNSLLNTESRFLVSATDSETGEEHFFENADFHFNDCSALKASCAIPMLCKPVEIGGKSYYDGGVAEPVPFEKLFDEGCDKIAVVLTLPRDFVKKPEMLHSVYRRLLRKSPRIVACLEQRHLKYMAAIKRLNELEAEGRAVLISPKNLFGINTTVRSPEKLRLLYNEGYEDAGLLVKEFSC